RLRWRGRNSCLPPRRGAVPIHIAFGHARLCVRAGAGGDGFYAGRGTGGDSVLLVPVVLSRGFARGLTGGNIAGCKVPVNDAVLGLLVHATAAGLAGGEVTRALSLRGGRLGFLLIGLRLSGGEER